MVNSAADRKALENTDIVCKKMRCIDSADKSKGNEQMNVLHLCLLRGRCLRRVCSFSIMPPSANRVMRVTAGCIVWYTRAKLTHLQILNQIIDRVKTN